MKKNWKGPNEKKKERITQLFVYISRAFFGKEKITIGEEYEYVAIIKIARVIGRLYRVCGGGDVLLYFRLAE